MRKFLCKKTGAILLVTNEFTLKQVLKSEFYEEIIEVKKTSDVKSEKKISDYNKKELVDYLTNLGIECSENMKKDELLLLVPSEDDE